MGKSSLPNGAGESAVCAHPEKFPPPNHKQMINVQRYLFMLPLNNHHCVNCFNPLADYSAPAISNLASEIFVDPHQQTGAMARLSAGLSRDFKHNFSSKSCSILQNQSPLALSL